MSSTLRTHELTKSYSGRTVVRGVSLEVNSGEVVGLLGPNGAGKTTTFYMAVRLTAADSGRVTLDGVNSPTIRYVCARAGHRTCHRAVDLPGLTVEQNITGDPRDAGSQRGERRTRLRERSPKLGLTPLASAAAYRCPAASGGAPRSRVRW